MNLKIEKNIPIHRSFRKAIIAPKILSTLDKMKRGNSFVLPSKNRGYTTVLAKGRGIELAIRHIEDQPGFVRVWKVK